MKTASYIFIILGMIVNFFAFQTPLMGIIGVGVGIWALITLSNNEKSKLCGILAVLFTGLLGGIFYLCWDPEKE